MSTEISSDMWRYSKQKGSHLLLLAALADYANAEGWCWPSIRSLCARTRMSERYVQKMINDIVKDGELQIKERPGSSNYYRVTIGVHPSAPVLPSAERGAAEYGGGVLPSAPRTVKEPSKEPSSIARAEEIYKAYPRKIAKPAALKAISAALKRGIEAAALLALTEAYAQAVACWPDEDKGFVPYPQKWFNQERYNDDQETWKRRGGATAKQPRKPITEANAL